MDAPLSKKGHDKHLYIYSISLSLLLLSFLLLHPYVQGLLVYLNVPYYLWIDYSSPNVPHWFNNGLSHPTTQYTISSTLTPHVQLGVWYTKSSTKSSAKRVVLYLHGNGESRADGWSLQKYSFFAAMPLEMDIVSFDYRGFGDSTGWPTEAGVYEDAYTVWKWMTSPQGLHLNTSQISIYGHSLGSSVAAQLASRLSTQGTPPANLVLEAPFTNLVNVVTGYLPFPYVRDVLQNVLHHRFETKEHLKKIKDDVPILLVHGKNDWVISYRNSEELLTDGGYQRQLLLVEGASHNDIIHSTVFKEKLIAFWGGLEVPPHFIS